VRGLWVCPELYPGRLRSWRSLGLSPGALIFAIDEDGCVCWRHPFTMRVAHAEKVPQGQPAMYVLFEPKHCDDPGCDGAHLEVYGRTQSLQTALDWACGFDKPVVH
jgi:hypothetical protein